MSKAPDAQQDRKEYDGIREKMKPFLDALYEECLDHESCDYDFSCIIESVTLWEKFDKAISAAHKAGYEEALIKAIELIGTDETLPDPVPQRMPSRSPIRRLRVRISARNDLRSELRDVLFDRLLTPPERKKG